VRQTGRVSKLAEYRRKRDPARTPEPMPGDGAAGSGDSFVVQEHHASALHWDFRLERDGVLVSWAVPKGIPPDPKVNHLAVRTEDHPLEYASFEGTIAHGEYGGGKVKLWDRGTYSAEKWSDREVMVVLDGERVQGRFVLFRTGGKNWMMHRMDAPVRPDWQALPGYVEPMLATPGRRRAAGTEVQWAYEMTWDGARVLAEVDGGRVTLFAAGGPDVTAGYPELRGLGLQLGATQALLDGELVVLGSGGRPDPGRLAKRVAVSDAADGRGAAAVRRVAKADPVVLMIFDVLHLDGRALLAEPYGERRGLLDRLELEGPGWQTPPAVDGDGAVAMAVSREYGLGGVTAKRLSSAYRPGPSKDWVMIPGTRR
jgi:bifunctional non-homologous end joining protein LigD